MVLNQLEKQLSDDRRIYGHSIKRVTEEGEERIAPEDVFEVPLIPHFYCDAVAGAVGVVWPIIRMA